MGEMKLKNLFVITMIVSSLLSITAYSIEAVDVTITDATGDVYSIDYLTGEAKVVTNHSDIEVDNLDLIQATYTKTGTQATVSLQVKGNIENRGEFIDPYDPFIDNINMVEYDFELITSGQYYSLGYCNETGRLYFGYQQINLTSSDFSVVGNTLTITFPLTSTNEVYENLSVSSSFLKANLSEEEPVIVFLTDIAPTPPLWVDGYAQSYIGYVGENIEFYGYVEPLSGHPPFTYYWDFGDGGSSTQLNPTHIYTKAGDYMYTFTVTDSKAATASVSYNITIVEVKKAFLFGRFTYMVPEGDFMLVVSDNIGMILFKPFQVQFYAIGEYIMFLNNYKGVIISNKFLIGMFNVLIEPEPTLNIACTTNTPVNNRATQVLQRLLPENIFNSLGCL